MGIKIVANGTSLLGIRMDSEVYRVILSAHIQPNAKKQIGAAFQLLKTERPANKQQLKVAAVKAWQSASKKTQDLVMSVGSRL